MNYLDSSLPGIWFVWQKVWRYRACCMVYFYGDIPGRSRLVDVLCVGKSVCEVKQYEVS